MMKKNKITGVYGIMCPENKVYIGQSKDIIRRTGEHRRLDGYRPKELADAILNHGWDKCSIELLYSLPNDVSQDVLDEYEKFFMMQYKESGLTLFNIKEGGKKAGHSQETIKKMVESNKGRENPYMKELNKNRIWNNNAKEGIIKANKKRKWSDESIKKMSKPVYQYTLDWVLVKDWISIHSAARATKIDRKSISTCAKENHRHAGGFKWSFLKIDIITNN